MTEQEQALARLQEVLKPGDTVYTILRHVSGSGMTRWISVVKPTDNGFLDLDYSVRKLLGEKMDRRHEGIKRGGCGMDMGFDLVYSLSRRMFPDGFDCVANEDGRGCPSNDHSNYPGHCAVCAEKHWHGETYDHVFEQTPTPRHHTEGGYALSQRWL